MATDSRRHIADGENGTVVAGNRYLVLHEHARGGMGVVSVARDQELWRDVAFKEMKLEFAASPRARRRFIAEGEVTGRLEHPGIVPVYGLGSFEDGRPFYAMRFIQGQSLLEALRSFHGQAKTNFAGLEFRNLLKRFVDACNAVGYAHSRGYIHRDLKPANVMLGPFGETLVVDWGLAKAIGAPPAGEPEPEAAVAENESPVDAAADFEETAAYSTPVAHANSTAASGDQTQMGQVVGTLAYMPPEQAEGRWDLVDARADVYSLGATLFEILIGRMPFIGSQREVLADVRAGRLQSPRSIKKEVPGALDAVCRKTMARNQEDRYASSIELAADVERWLADEPLQAYREPLFARIRRWGRKHRTLVTSLALLLITITIALAIGLILVNKERADKAEAYRLEKIAQQSLEQSLAQERKAREAEQKALVAESKALTAARTALDATTDDLVGKVLGRQGPLGRTEREFLQRLVRAYSQFESDDDAKPHAKRLAAQARLRIAKVEERLGDKLSSAEGYRKAIATFKEQIEQTNDKSLRSDLAEALLSFARTHFGVNSKEALIVLKEGLELREALFVELKTAQAHQDMATAILEGAEMLTATGQMNTAEDLYRKLIRVYQPLLLNGQLGREAVEAVGKAYDQLAYAAENRPKPNLDEAYAHLDNAIGVFLILEKQFPDEPRYRGLQLLARSSRTAVLRKVNKQHEAEMQLKTIVVEYRNLVEDNPGVRDFRQGLATALINLAITLQERDQSESSIAPLEEARKLLVSLSRQYPDYQDYRVGATAIAGDLIKLYERHSRLEDAKRMRNELEKVKGKK